MNIINVSTILPLENLKRENDIVVRIQENLARKYAYEFEIVKSLPYVNKFLSNINKKWKLYYKYQNEKIVSVSNFKTIIYPWISPPTSNFCFNCIFIPINFIFYKVFYKKLIIKNFNTADLILAQNTIPDSLIAYWLSKDYNVPYILNIRGNFNTKIIDLPIFKKIYKNSFAVITHSPVNYKKLKTKIEINLILHPIDEIFYDNSEKDFSFIRLVTVCRLIKLKNIDWVIDALSALNVKKCHFEYHIVGDGPELHSLMDKAKKFNLTDKIFFHGHKDRLFVADILKKSHIFIMPSYPETLGRAFLEAAASGCLCIGHKNTGVDGFFTDHESGFFVTKESISARLEKIYVHFSKCFVESYTNKSKKMVENLTWEKICDEYNNLYLKSRS